MWFHHRTLLVCCIIVSYTFASHLRPRRQVGTSCRTPDQRSGTCINIKSCPYLINLLTTSAGNATVTYYLQRSQCGIEGSTPKVCCPSGGGSNGGGNFAGTTHRPNTVVSRQPTNGAATSRPTNIRNPQPPSNNGDFGAECGKSEKKDTRIVGGKNATLGDWPWMVGLGYRSASRPGPEFKCGATLISRYWVITAAHCVQGTGGFSVSVARLGDLNLNQEINDGANPIDVPVHNITVHPQYSTNPMINDIALIRLRNPVQFERNIRPICLLSGVDYKRNEYYNRKRPFIIGWGALEWRGATTTMLQETGINMVDIPTCAQKYANQRSALINDKVLCAGERGKDTCQGDSGGPLIFPEVSASGTETTFYLGGIVSYGIRCDNPDYPGVYTRVAEFIDWINQVTGERF